MSELEMPASHRHLPAEALWELAEAEVLKLDPSHDLASVKSCPQCGPAFQKALVQLQGMRSLPLEKAPSDFLALVQKRIAAEESLGHRLLRWIFPSRRSAWGVPMGFASAVLLVLVLIVVMPRSPLREFVPESDRPSQPTEVSPPSNQPSHPLETPAPWSSLQGAPVTAPAPAQSAKAKLEDAPRNLGDDDKTRPAASPPVLRPAAPPPATLSSEAPPASGFFHSTAEPQASPKKKASRDAQEKGGSRANAEEAVAKSDLASEPEPESKLQPIPADEPAMGGAISQASEGKALAKSEERSAKDRLAKPQTAHSLDEQKPGRENNLALDTLADFHKVRQGDTLVVTGLKTQAQRLKVWLSAKQWQDKSKVSFLGDSVQARIWPLPELQK